MTTPHKPRSRRRRGPRMGAPPEGLSRAPRTDLQVRTDELDRRAFVAIDAAVERLVAGVEQCLSLDHIKLLTTKAHLLLAMRSTHRSIRHLLNLGPQHADLTVDALALTRIQLERCFLALLLEDNPKRWHIRYRKNAWKAFAQKFFCDKRLLGSFPPYEEHFGPSGRGIGMLRAFAREMNVWEDEFQTLRADVLGDEPDPRWNRREIVEMPHPARTPEELDDPDRQALARLLYPFYNNLSSFSHGGLVGVMMAAVLRPGFALAGEPDFDKGTFWARNVLEPTLPNSYVAILLVGTLFSAEFLGADEGLRQAFEDAWCPYHSEGSPLGVAVWDAWARKALSPPTAPPQT